MNHTQLDNCDLTFSDITRIRQMLKTKLPSIYHVRIAYPELKDPKSEKPNPTNIEKCYFTPPNHIEKCNPHL